MRRREERRGEERRGEQGEEGDSADGAGSRRCHRHRCRRARGKESERELEKEERGRRGWRSSRWKGSSSSPSMEDAAEEPEERRGRFCRRRAPLVPPSCRRCFVIAVVEARVTVVELLRRRRAVVPPQELPDASVTATPVAVVVNRARRGWSPFEATAGSVLAESHRNHWNCSCYCHVVGFRLTKWTSLRLRIPIFVASGNRIEGSRFPSVQFSTVVRMVVLSRSRFEDNYPCDKCEKNEL
ncbi:hypothetical protein AHAS_Ahas20G0181400 [Arachis hypogaea]